MHPRNNSALKKASIVLLITSLLASCSTVTIRPQGGTKDRSQADYIDSKPFYFSGLIGKHKVNVNDACEGNDVTQMQTVTTSSDWLMGIITLFIYAPRTAKVWCEESQ